MASYLCPGVYVEEVSSGSKPIGSVATAVAAIIGNTYGGTANEPTFVSSFKEYTNVFGPIAGTSDVVGNYVEAFFNNGGGRAYVVSAHVASVALGTLSDPTLIKVESTDYAEIAISSAIELNLAYAPTTETFNVKIGSTTTPLNGSSLKAYEASLNEVLKSNHLTATVLCGELKDLIDFLPAGIDAAKGKISVSGGAAALSDSVSSADLSNAVVSCLQLVEDIDAVTMLLLPEFSLASTTLSSNAVYTKALAQCEKLKDRMVLIDPPQGMTLDGNSELPINSSYAALYYPWVEVANGAKVSPSAFAAGMWGKIDGKRGVWKAPAGLETGLLGVHKFESDVNNAKQEQLNPKGINVLRKMNGTPVVWGARTLATQADPEWRYIPVRRTFMMVEESVQEGIQWAVFEPNSMNLWQALKLNIESYLNGLWRAGAFQGATADQAYFVRCGLGSTMTQGEIDEGKVIIEMGFAPLKPAEFVIIRIQQKVGQA